jgi:hypothetical protein
MKAKEFDKKFDEGVTRQSIINIWLADRLKETAA